MHRSIDDVEYLVRSAHRVTALGALARRPQSRRDLRTMTDVSQSTIGRTLREFEERNWIRRDGNEYEATELGAFVAAAMEDVLDRVETERSLRDVWEWLPGVDSGFSLDLCSDAVITIANADDPYRPVNRFLELVAGTDRIRFVGFDVAILEPCRDELEREIVEGGTETEAIVPSRVARYSRTTTPKQFASVLESGNLTVRVHDDLPPYGVMLFDERVAIAGYDRDNVTVRVLIDSDGDQFREWAESLYGRYRRQDPTTAIGTDSE